MTKLDLPFFITKRYPPYTPSFLGCFVPPSDIFPLKALALDQMRKLRSLVKAMPNNRLKLALMTGDTPANDRQRLFIPNPPNILAVSPDLLHHYLYNVRRRKVY
ncbi:hypothetical protein ACF3DV_32985 (plasmid) [Chlorogloeopsis fritschii PCC 9212]|uniref:Uncharacterized protein n=2 Tax=Chlorogloeopsis fritschii TaxID=1124 RepID=A0A3S5K296_CHLFR|nr:hypothetical protein [Chlorogloeopsis fritschii]RUR83761.1 hypothetical protein PCC6912_20040 [Chlorogloeopsis fritschii PCC 6912]